MGRVSDLCDFRSKSVILLPTGEMTVLPSGVKMRSPVRYTVPYRFENRYENFMLSERIFDDRKFYLYNNTGYLEKWYLHILSIFGK